MFHFYTSENIRKLMDIEMEHWREIDQCRAVKRVTTDASGIEPTTSTKIWLVV